VSVASPVTRAWAREAQALLALAAPVIVTRLGQVALQVTDVMLVGHLLGAHMLAPMVLATNLLSIPLLVGMGSRDGRAAAHCACARG
jgi:MATE family multidrug resistance protein